MLSPITIPLFIDKTNMYENNKSERQKPSPKTRPKTTNAMKNNMQYKRK